MKVIFRPSVDEHVEFLAESQRQRQSKTTNTITWIFFSFNLGFVPAILFLNDLVWVALAVFAFNALVMIVLLSWQNKNSLRKYYEDVWPELEQHDCEIAVDEKGVECEHAGNQNFYPWENVRSIGETDRLVFFDVGPTYVLASKRGFSNHEEAKAFIEIANNAKSSSSVELQ